MPETYYMVTGTDMTNVANAIRAKGETSDALTWPAGWKTAIDNIPKYIIRLYSGEIADSYSSTTAASLTTINLGSQAFTSEGILYVQVRDKAGKRDGYYYGTDAFIYNRNPITDPTSNLSLTTNSGFCPKITFRTSASTHNIASYSSYAGYGIYPYSLSTAGILNMYHAYNSSYSLTINGTFTIQVYHILGPFTDWYQVGT